MMGAWKAVATARAEGGLLDPEPMPRPMRRYPDATADLPGTGEYTVARRIHDLELYCRPKKRRSGPTRTGRARRHR